MLEEWSVTSCNKVTSPGVKDERSEEAEVPLAGPAASLYRRTVARLNYWVQDRADLAFATKEVARTMSAPSTKDVVKLKRILRYVRGHPRGRLLFEWQELPVQLVAQVDIAIGQDAHEFGTPLLVAHSALESTAWRTGHELQHRLHCAQEKLN